MDRTPRREQRSERNSRRPYERPAAVEGQTDARLSRSTSLGNFSFSGFRNLLASFRPSSAQGGLPTHSGDLRSESGSEDEFNGQGPAPTMADMAVAELRRDGQKVNVGSFARSISQVGLSQQAADAGPSRRKEARLALKQKSEQLDLNKSNFGLASPATPLVPGHFAAMQTSYIDARASAIPATSQPLTAAAVSAEAGPSRSPLAAFGNRLSRIFSPPSASPSAKKRFRETETPSRLPRPADRAPAPNLATPASISFAPALVTPATQASRSLAEEARMARDSFEKYKAELVPGQETAHDYYILSALSRAAEEAERAAQPESHSRIAGQTQARTTWAANTAEGTPRLIRPMRSSAAPGTPGSVFTTAPASPAFSVGTAGSLAGTPRGQKVYLGPGMSSRRLNASRSNLRDSTPFSMDGVDDEADPKRRRTGSPLVRSQESQTAGVSGQASPIPPVHNSAARNAAAIGKRRAANIMMDLVDAELGAIRPERPSIIVNPYDTSAPPPVISQNGRTLGTPGAAMRTATPPRSILRRSTAAAEAESTPSRGAAARLEAHTSGTPLTTLEILQGKTPWELSTGKGKGKADGRGSESSGRHVRVETPDRERDDLEVEDVVEETPSKSTGRGQAGVLGAPAAGSASGPASQATAPTASKSIPVIEVPVKTDPLPAPQLGFSSFGTPSNSAFGSRAEPAPSFSVPSTFDSPSSPAFKPTPVKAPAAPADAGPGLSLTPSKPFTSVAKSERLSAKDIALKVDEAALPFFTYTISARTGSAPSAKTQQKALGRDSVEFVFTTDIVSEPAGIVPTPFNWAAAGATAPKPGNGEWKCEACECSSPASATKCIVCDTEKPASTSTIAPVTAAKFDWSAAGTAPPKASSSGWTCDTCMCVTPDDQQKCVACETIRPAPKKTPAVPSSAGFDWSKAGGSAPKKAAGWTCDTCACVSRESSDKCDVCEMPRPAGK